MAAAATLRLAHRGDHRGHPENSARGDPRARWTSPAATGSSSTSAPSADDVPVARPRRDARPGPGPSRGGRRADGGRARARSGCRALDEALVALCRAGRSSTSSSRRSSGAASSRSSPPVAARTSTTRSCRRSIRSAIGRIRDLVPGWPCWLNARRPDRRRRSRSAVELGCVGVSVEAGAIDARAFQAADARPVSRSPPGR